MTLSACSETRCGGTASLRGCVRSPSPAGRASDTFDSLSWAVRMTRAPGTSPSLAVGGPSVTLGPAGRRSRCHATLPIPWLRGNADCELKSIPSERRGSKLEVLDSPSLPQKMTFLPALTVPGANWCFMVAFCSVRRFVLSRHAHTCRKKSCTRSMSAFNFM